MHQYEGNARDDFNVNLVCVNADELPEFAWRMGPEFFEGRYSIGLWAWELEEFPYRFDDAYDEVDEVWVLSGFVRNAIASHTNKPVFIFPLPVVPPRVPLSMPKLVDRLPEGYRFLFCFDMMSVFERKNPLGLVQAFAKGFSPGDGAALLIKVVNGERNLGKLEQLKLTASRHPDVVVIDGYLSVEENAALFAASDCYVSLHRSEGFGLTLAEAMALGKPTIATGYSGNLEFMTTETSYLVPYTDGKVPEGCEPYRKGARWAEPNLDAAAHLMRHVFFIGTKRKLSVQERNYTLPTGILPNDERHFSEKDSNLRRNFSLKGICWRIDTVWKQNADRDPVTDQSCA